MIKRDKTKTLVGEVVFRNIKDRSGNQRRDEEMQKVIERKSAQLISESPYVSRSFYEEGLVKDGKLTNILHVFQPNLWAQDFAYGVNQLHLLDITSANLRAETSLEYKLRNTNFSSYLKSIGKNPYDALLAYEKSTLRESGMIQRLGGVKMEKEVEKNIDIGLAKRVFKDNYMAGKIIKSLGVDERDNEGMFQVNEALSVTENIKQRVMNDPYIARRKNIISVVGAKAEEINSERSVKMDAIKDKDLVNALVMSVIKNKPYLIKDIEKALKEEGVSINALVS